MSEIDQLRQQISQSRQARQPGFGDILPLALAAYADLAGGRTGGQTTAGMLDQRGLVGDPRGQADANLETFIKAKELENQGLRTQSAVDRNEAQTGLVNRQIKEFDLDAEIRELTRKATIDGHQKAAEEYDRKGEVLDVLEFQWKEALSTGDPSAPALRREYFSALNNRTQELQRGKESTFKDFMNNDHVWGRVMAMGDPDPMDRKLLQERAKVKLDPTLSDTAKAAILGMNDILQLGGAVDKDGKFAAVDEESFYQNAIQEIGARWSSLKKTNQLDRVVEYAWETMPFKSNDHSVSEFIEDILELRNSGMGPSDIIPNLTPYITAETTPGGEIAVEKLTKELEEGRGVAGAKKLERNKFLKMMREARQKGRR